LKRLLQCEKMNAPISMKRCRVNIFLREVSIGWISPDVISIDRLITVLFFYAKTSNCECFRSHDSNLSITSHYINAKLSNFEFIPMRKNYKIFSRFERLKSTNIRRHFHYQSVLFLAEWWFASRLSILNSIGFFCFWLACGLMNEQNSLNFR